MSIFNPREAMTSAEWQRAIGGHVAEWREAIAEADSADVAEELDRFETTMTEGFARLRAVCERVTSNKGR